MAKAKHEAPDGKPSTSEENGGPRHDTGQGGRHRKDQGGQKPKDGGK